MKAKDFSTAITFIMYLHIPMITCGIVFFMATFTIATNVFITKFIMLAYLPLAIKNLITFNDLRQTKSIKLPFLKRLKIINFALSILPLIIGADGSITRSALLIILGLIASLATSSCTYKLRKIIEKIMDEQEPSIILEPPEQS